MKKVLSIVVFTLMTFVVQAQISFPSTYKYTKKIFGDERCNQIVSYFIFDSPSKIIWCFESYDGYIFPIAMGAYNSAQQTLVFTKQYSTWSAFYMDDKITFKIQTDRNNNIIMNSDEEFSFFFDDNGRSTLIKCDYVLTPSNKLVGSSWKFEETYDNNGEMITEKLIFYFRSTNEVLLDGEPHIYILIGNTIGILSGDNPEKEALVGKWYDKEMEIHRSGCCKRNYPWFTIKRTN